MATLERREQTPGRVTYRVRWFTGGKQRSKSFKSYADAKRFKAVLEGDMVNGTFMDPRNGAVSLESFGAEYLHTTLIDVRASTKARILSIYKTHILPEFGHLPLSAITAPAVTLWVHQMTEQMSPATVRKNAFVLRRVLDQAVAHGILRANPASLVRLPAEPRHEQRYLTHAQVWDLAETIEPRFRAMVLVAVFGGLRFGEVTALTRANVIPETNQIRVKQTVVEVAGSVSFGPPKTKTSIRTVTLPRSIMAELTNHMDEYTKDDINALVFTGQRNVVIRRSWFYRYYWVPATLRAGLEGLRFHDLRHTFVALWVSLGRNPKEVSKAAGHSSVAFTLDRYGHLYETDSDGLADELDSLLGSSRSQGLPRTSERPREGRRPDSTERERGQRKPFQGGSTGSNPVGGTGAN